MNSLAYAHVAGSCTHLGLAVSLSFKTNITSIYLAIKLSWPLLSKNKAILTIVRRQRQLIRPILIGFPINSDKQSYFINCSTTAIPPCWNIVVNKLKNYETDLFCCLAYGSLCNSSIYNVQKNFENPHDLLSFLSRIQIYKQKS